MKKLVLVLILILVLLLCGGAGYLYLERLHADELEQAQQRQDAAVAEAEAAADLLARELIQDSTRLLAAVVSGLVDPDDRTALDDLLAAAVQGNRLVGIIVVDSSGLVLSSTDLRYRGRTLDDRATLMALATEQPIVADLAPAPGQVEVAAPLLAEGVRIGAIRAFYALDKNPER